MAGGAKIHKVYWTYKINIVLETRIHFKRIDWFTKGNYKCEVTAEDFETADQVMSTDVVGKCRYK